MLCNCEISTLTLFPRIFNRHTKFLHTSNETLLVLRHRLWFPGWLQFHYLVMDDLQFLILPPLPPKCCAFKDMYRYIQFMLCLDWNLSSILARQALYQMSYYWIPQTYFLKFVDSVLLQVLFYLRNYTCLVHDILTQYFLRSRIPLPVFYAPSTIPPSSPEDFMSKTGHFPYSISSYWPELCHIPPQMLPCCHS